MKLNLIYWNFTFCSRANECKGKQAWSSVRHLSELTRQMQASLIQPIQPIQPNSPSSRPSSPCELDSFHLHTSYALHPTYTPRITPLIPTEPRPTLLTEQQLRVMEGKKLSPPPTKEFKCIHLSCEKVFKTRFSLKSHHQSHTSKKNIIIYKLNCRD